MKTRLQTLPDLPGSRGQRVARCQNTACMSAQRSGLGEEELALLTLSGWGREAGGLGLMEPTGRVSNGLGRGERGGTTRQRGFTGLREEKIQRLREYLVLIFPSTHTLCFLTVLLHVDRTSEQSSGGGRLDLIGRCSRKVFKFNYVSRRQKLFLNQPACQNTWNGRFTLKI